MYNKEPTEHKSIITDYFDITKIYQEKYGEKTILLMQVGAFFEVYGLKNNTTGDITHSKIVEFSQATNLNIADKKFNVNNCQVVMAGFRDYVLDKYIKKIIDDSFTAVVYIQEKNGNTVTRKFHSVHSSGTYISYDTDVSKQTSNNIMCIWMETFKPFLTPNPTIVRDTIVYGVAVINIFTGDSSLFEYQAPFFINPTTFDELERCVSTYNPSEVIFLSEFDDPTTHTIIKFAGIQCNVIRVLNIKNDEKAQNCMKQKYIHHILSTFYQPDIYDVCSEFNENSIATQSFCYLLNFIQEHNPDLVRKIELPTFSNTSNRVILANHTLKQLNIIDDKSNDGISCGNLSSVLSFLNRCSCSMGRRLFKSQLLNPTFDQDWLNKEYDMIDLIRKPDLYSAFVLPLRKQIQQIRDMEKILRQLVSHKLYPSSIFFLYKSVEIVQQINTCLYENQEICLYLCNDTTNPYEFIDNYTKYFLEFIDKHLYIDLCHNVNSVQTFEHNIIRPNISKKLDDMLLKQREYTTSFETIRVFFNQLMRSNENNPSSQETDYIKIHETEKSGVSFQITKKRATTLKTILTNLGKTSLELKINDSISVSIKDIKLTSASTTSDELEFPLLNKICKGMFKIQEELNQTISIIYSEVLGTMEQDWFEQLEFLAKYVSKLDVLLTKTFISQEYKYCRPEISNEQEKSFVDAQDLRHVLIEHIQTNEIYVPNNVYLGKNDQDGILLYGTNAVGKTSLIRSLGISIIMAQSGMFVPCSKFVYKPYCAIFSRILGNDNLFKGLSTFQVEMSELRMILKMSDANSLILGDELCSGTETESALAIFMAGLIDLFQKESSFIFATHFHEIIHYDEMKDLPKIQLKHMSVIYDREDDCLIYDRRLKDGPGNKMYGLEVCKSLYLPEDFLVKAYEIRNKYHPETKGGLSNSISHFNQQKVRGLCEICNTEIAEETHHLLEQQDADENGFIGTVHKNHLANLVSICEKCHRKEHSHENTNKPKKIKRVKTTNGFKIT